MKILDYKGLQFDSGKKEKTSDTLTVEEALQIEINGEVFTVTMQTPGDEAILARGLLISEGIISSDQSFDAKVLETNILGHVKRINVITDVPDLKSVIDKRSLLSAASCGICGNRELEMPEGESLTGDFSFNPALIREMYAVMEQYQTGFAASGGCHAAAIFDGSGEMLALKEDVGRHNAVDKSVGLLASEGRLSQSRFLLVSGRISYEIVAKCFKAKIPILAAVSAPSSLAVDFAKELGITLLAFCRDERCTCYSHPFRLNDVNSEG